MMLVRFLGGMSLLADCGTADSAMWSDWLECVAKAKQEQSNMGLNLKNIDAE